MELSFGDVTVDLKNKVVRATAEFKGDDAEAQFKGVVVKGDDFVTFLDGLAQAVMSQFAAPRWAEDAPPAPSAEPEDTKEKTTSSVDDIDLDKALSS